MQAGNILVPVGEDQLPHLEMTRQLARRFNREFAEIFPEPDQVTPRARSGAGAGSQLAR